MGKTAIEALARVPAEVDIASEFRYRDPIDVYKRQCPSSSRPCAVKAMSCRSLPRTF